MAGEQAHTLDAPLVGVGTVHSGLLSGAGKAYVCLLAIGAAAGAFVCSGAAGAGPEAPEDSPDPSSAFAKCGCSEFLGTVVLTPMYVIFSSQLWVVLQTGLVGFAILVAKRGFSGARTWVHVCGGPSLFLATSVVDCSRIVWLGFLSVHVLHFAAIVVGSLRRGLPMASAFHEVYFTFVNSGVVTFVVFATLGSLAASALVESAARLATLQRTERDAADLMARLDKNGDGYADDEEIRPYYEYGLARIAEGFGCDPDVGLDAEGLRKLSALNSPFYDWDLAEQRKGQGEGTTPLDPGDVLICGTQWSKTSWDAAVPMVRGEDCEGLPAWACPHPRFGLKQLRSEDGRWVYIKGDDASVAPEPDKSEQPHDGEAPHVCWPEYVRTACLADVDSTPTFATMKLEAEARRSTAARSQRSTVVLGTVATILAPVAASHLAFGALLYSPIIAVVAGLAMFVLAASVGFGELHGDVTHSNWFVVAKGAGGFEGYYMPPALRCLTRPYSALAGWLRTRPVMLRLVVMNMALAGCALCVQLCFNYSLLRYTGQPYVTTPLVEFAGRKISCVVCMRRGERLARAQHPELGHVAHQRRAI